MQQIFITGNLVRDAELKVSIKQGNKNEFVAFTVACNEKKGDADEVNYYDVTSNKTGVYEYLKKGQKVIVEGRFRPTLTQDEKGKSYLHLNINATLLELAGGSGKKEAAPQDNAPEDLPD